MKRDASFIIREKATKKVILETFDPKVAAAINKSKYEAIPILDYLQEFNRSVKTKNNPSPSNEARNSRFKKYHQAISAKMQSAFKSGDTKLFNFYGRKLNKLVEIFSKPRGKKSRKYRKNPERTGIFVVTFIGNDRRKYYVGDSHGRWSDTSREKAFRFETKRKAEVVARRLYKLGTHVEEWR